MTAPQLTALLVVDMQLDYLSMPGLQPEPDHLVARVASLLSTCRDANAPIAHIMTMVRADGTDAMPHWRNRQPLPCVEGTPGAAPPPDLLPRPGELVARKQHYQAFADHSLDPWLRARGVTHLVLCGLHEHACVRETALAAYECGYQVAIASDAVGTDSPDHAAHTRQWLSARGMRYADVTTIEAELQQHHGPAAVSDPISPARLVRSAHRVWRTRDPQERVEIIRAWADVLSARSADVVQAIIDEVRKPRRYAEDEVRRAIEHIAVAAALAIDPELQDRHIAPGIELHHEPVGVVGLLMPWNNPVALPCGKIASALVLGNGVVFKPAPEADGCARLLVQALADAGLPDGLVGLIQGDAHVGAQLVDSSEVDAVAVTGAIATGRSIALECARLGKPLQAELGGNNAVVVLPDADLDVVVPDLVRNAFAFAGQRCTALRRFIVHREILEEFQQRASAATQALVVGDPNDPATEVGPLISAAAQVRIRGIIERATANGAVVLARGTLPALAGAFVAPTLLRVDDRSSEVVQQESFGPIAVIQPAESLADAVLAANGVVQGLLQAVCTRDEHWRSIVIDAADVGIVQVGGAMLPVHARAPFGGWKASGYGPPEHGVWDARLLTRPQVRYLDDVHRSVRITSSATQDADR